jgi:1-deoxy-D-xylulose-5-phosphate reductoisomerase
MFVLQMDVILALFGENILKYKHKILQVMEQKKKGVAVLGSTGFIGQQALNVIANYPDHFELVAITGNSNSDLLIEQAIRFQPNTVVIADESQLDKVRNALWNEDVKVFAGSKSVDSIVEMTEIDVVFTAISGFTGLSSVLKAIDSGKNIALANKETLVLAGELVTQRAYEKGVNIYPVDAELSSIFQAIVGEFHNPIEKIYLTTTGNNDQTNIHLEKLTNSSYNSAKRSIDNVTLINKGFEVIEAHWLFGIQPNQIEVLIHPQSIVNSLVQFKDGAVKTQIGFPNLEIPIQYSLTFPHRFPTTTSQFNPLDFPNWTFDKPDQTTYMNLALSYEALEMKGTAPCVLYAANEEAVRLFLENKIELSDITRINAHVLRETKVILNPTLDELKEAYTLARQAVLSVEI